MSNIIETKIEYAESVPDQGVVKKFTADETFNFEGETVARETTVALLSDGGVHISQATDQGTYDSLTLSEAVADELVKEVGGDA